MKILDYITTMVINDKKMPAGLTDFAIDPNSDVYAIENGGAIVIFETEKCNQNNTNNNLKYSMYALGVLDRGFVKGANTKEELINDYANLVALGFLNEGGYSSLLTKTLKKQIEALHEYEKESEI